MSMIYQDEKGIHEVDGNKIRVSKLPEYAFTLHTLGQFSPRPDCRTVVNGRETAGVEGAVAVIRDLVGGKIVKPVLLAGSPGLGKTHLAHAAGVMALRQGWFVAYYKVADLLDELKQGYDVNDMPRDQRGPEDITYDVIMRWVKDLAHLLIIDDLGLEKQTGWSAEKLDQVLTYREENNMPVLLTSNSLDPDKISRRVLDRCKVGAIVLIKGPSFRGTGSKSKD